MERTIWSGANLNLEFDLKEGEFLAIHVQDGYEELIIVDANGNPARDSD